MRWRAGAFALGISGGAWGQEEVEVVAPTPGFVAASTGGLVSVPTALDVADLLDTLPGVTIRRLGGAGAWAGISVRGSAMRQVQVHLDGMPLNPDGGEAVNLGELPSGLVRQVRVWRAMAPPSYAAAPIGGVVDVRTVAPTEEVRGAGALTWGSTGWLAASGSVAGGRGPVSAVGGVDLVRSDGRFRYLDDGGTRFVEDDDQQRVRENAGLGQIAGLARAEVRVGGATVTVLDAMSWREEGFPGPVGAPAFEASTGAWRNLVGATVRGGGMGLGSELRLWRVDRGVITRDPAAEVGIGTTQRRDRMAVTGGTLVSSWAPSEAARVGLVLSGRVERLTRSTDTERLGRAVVGGSLDTQVALGPVTLWPVLDVRAVVDDAGTTGAMLPRLGVSVAVAEGVTLDASAGMTWRPPDMMELYGLRGAVRGNPELRPEDGVMVDVGVRASRGAPWGAWTLDLRGFLSEVDDLVVWIQNAQRSLVPVNVGHARTVGVELAVGLRAGRWSASGQLSVQDPRNRSQDPLLRGLRLPAVPSVSADARVEVTVVRGFRIGALGEVVDGLFQDATNRYRVPVRATADLWVATRPWRRGPELTLGVRNVADSRSAMVPIDPLNPEVGDVRGALTDVAGWPLPGRTVFAGVRWEGW